MEWVIGNHSELSKDIISMPNRNFNTRIFLFFELRESFKVFLDKSLRNYSLLLSHFYSQQNFFLFWKCLKHISFEPSQYMGTKKRLKFIKTVFLLLYIHFSNIRCWSRGWILNCCRRSIWC
jgi:hypothetical protein